MAVAGMRGTGDWGTDERPKNFREMILWRDPNGSAPLTALMSKMRKETTDDPEFNWWEEELKPIRVKTAAVATTGQASVTLNTSEDADALDLVAGDVLLVEENPAASSSYLMEIVEVTSDPTASTTLAITRGAANTTANTGTIATNSYLLKIGSAHEEGSGAPKASNRNPTKYNNYTQIFKTVYDITNTAKETNIRTGDPLKNDKKRKMFDHAAAMEQGFLFGNPYEDTSGTKPKRYTGGLYYYLASNYDATEKPTIKVWTTTAIDEDDILDAIYQVWDYNIGGGNSANERLGLCGNGFLNYLNKIANSSASTRINYDGTIKFFGMQLQRWMLPQGDIYLRTHPLMNINSRFTNGCFLVNPPALRYRPLRNRDTKFKDNIQNNDEDRQKGQWLSEVGVEFNHLRSMRYLGIHV